MLRAKPFMLLVCLLVLWAAFLTNAGAVSFQPAAGTHPPDDVQAPPMPSRHDIMKVKPKKIYKVKPPEMVRPPELPLREAPSSLPFFGCMLPVANPRGFEADAEVFYARSKGKVRYVKSPWGTYSGGDYSWNWYGHPGSQEEVDLNSDLMLRDYNAVGSFTAKYRFRPGWTLRYNVTPMEVNGGGMIPRNFYFGDRYYPYGQNVKTKWERVYHRGGLLFDPVRTPSSRVGVFAEYVRINDSLTVAIPGCCSNRADMDLNMAMAGLELEKCVKTTASLQTLSIECKAGVAFLDESLGADVSTGLKYSVPIGNGRWGYLKGGYRYVSFKKRASELQYSDTAMEGGFLQLGLVF
ncbi:MAG: hypothetical protein V2B18_17880 [Pseudomonadota bacterium]